jgi:hypothetical protein
MLNSRALCPPCQTQALVLPFRKPTLIKRITIRGRSTVWHSWPAAPPSLTLCPPRPRLPAMQRMQTTQLIEQMDDTTIFCTQIHFIVLPYVLLSLDLSIVMQIVCGIKDEYL